MQKSLNDFFLFFCNANLFDLLLFKKTSFFNETNCFEKTNLFDLLFCTFFCCCNSIKRICFFVVFLFTFYNVLSILIQKKIFRTYICVFFIEIRIVWSFVNEHKQFALLTFNNSTIFYLRIFRYIQLSVFHLRYRKIFVRSMIRHKNDNIFRCDKHDMKIAKIRE